LKSKAVVVENPVVSHTPTLPSVNVIACSDVQDRGATLPAMLMEDALRSLCQYGAIGTYTWRRHTR
jgi:hypothetical protein